MDFEEKINRLRLFRSENVGSVTFRILMKHYQTAQKALEALPEKARRGGRDKPLKICSRNEAEAEFAHMQKIGAAFVFSGEDSFPAQLDAFADAPPLLAVLGNPAYLKKPSVAVVGTRNATVNGKTIARRMALDLVNGGYSVVSGMALGIDGAAHEGALYGANANASTVAVLGTGVDVVYPEQNRRIYDEIREKGAIVSEYAVTIKPQPSNFPQRNRIISGLSCGLVVIEATLRSGSLITANKALEQGKDVFAVPASPLDPRAAGVNHLIKNGAPLVESGQDVIDLLNDQPMSVFGETPVNDTPAPAASAAVYQEPDDKERKDILSLLDGTAIETDALIRETGLPAGVISALLVEWELAGRIERLPGNKIIRINSL